MYGILFFLSISILTPNNLLRFPRDTIVQVEISSDSIQLLRRIANDTWGYFRDIVDKETGLPLDHIKLSPKIEIGSYTSPTNIGLYMVSVISAYDLGFIERKEATSRIRRALSAVAEMEKFKGWLFNWYDLRPLKRTTDFISSVDSGWFTMGLIIARQTFPEISDLCTAIIDLYDFSFFYDDSIGQMWHGYDVKSGKYSPYHYGLLCTESRAMSLIAIGKGDVPKYHYFKIYRVLPGKDVRGSTKSYLGIDLFEGYHKYKDINIVPSWGGSLFEFLMPALFINEKEYAKRSLGVNDSLAVIVHIDYCLNEKVYPVWGMSPCCAPDYNYREYGVSMIGEKRDGYSDGVITSYATFLALDFLPNKAIENIKNLLSYDIYGEYSFYDSVDPITGDVAKIYLCLDQALILISLNNYLNNGIIRKRFHRDPIGVGIKELLSMEEFF
jgi:hypothetical protein